MIALERFDRAAQAAQVDLLLLNLGRIELPLAGRTGVGFVHTAGGDQLEIGVDLDLETAQHRVVLAAAHFACAAYHAS